jgi:alpha-1,2-mannosyltransferase
MQRGRLEQQVVEGLRTGSWLTLDRARVYCLILLAVYALSIVGGFLTANGLIDSSGRPLGTDFANIWSSGRLVLEGRAADAFDPAIQSAYQQDLLGMDRSRFYGWHYPPMFLAVAAVLALMPYLLGLLVWQATTAWLYVAVIQRTLSGIAIPSSTVVLAAVAYPASYACLLHGHNGFLTAALIGGGLLMLPTRPVLAGVLFGLLAYKPQFGLLIPVALVAVGAWRTIASAGCAVLVTVALSVAAFGVESWSAFFTFADFTRQTVLESGDAGWFKLQGVFPTVRMLGGSISAAYAIQAAAICALVAATFWLWRSEASNAQKAAGLILATMLATPYAFNYDTVMLGPAIALLVVDGVKRGFADYEKSLLTVLWVTPFVSRQLTQLVPFPFATFVCAVVFIILISKVQALSRPGRSVVHA